MTGVVAASLAHAHRMQFPGHVTHPIRSSAGQLVAFGCDGVDPSEPCAVDWCLRLDSPEPWPASWSEEGLAPLGVPFGDEI